jgi:hypothetical protein
VGAEDFSIYNQLYRLYKEVDCFPKSMDLNFTSNTKQNLKKDLYASWRLDDILGR